RDRGCRDRQSDGRYSPEQRSQAKNDVSTEPVDDGTDEQQAPRIRPVPSRQDVTHRLRRNVVQRHQRRSDNTERKPDHEGKQLSSKQQADRNDSVRARFILIHWYARQVYATNSANVILSGHDNDD